MIQNIILITLLILLFFFMSNEKSFNELVSKKYMKYLLLILIVYFIYQNYNIILLVIAVLAFLLFNTNFIEKLKTNKYLENFKNLSLLKNFIKKNIEKFSNFDLNQSNDNNDTENNNQKKTVEPFKEEVLKLKDLYENIKMQINKLK